MSFASEKIKEVKTDLIGFIKYETDLISRAVNNDTDDEYIHTDEEDWKWNPVIEVRVDNSYLDVYDNCTERRTVVSIGIIDGNVFILTSEGDEIQGEDLSVEELGTICDCLVESYYSLIKND